MMNSQKDVKFHFDRRINNFNPIPETNDIFYDPHIWEIKNIDYFSDSIIKEIERLKTDLIEFIKGGYSPHIFKNYRFKKLRKLALGLLKYDNIMDAIIETKYFSWNSGLEIAKILFCLENIEKGIIPIPEYKVKKSKVGRKILNVILRGDWKHYNNWNDFVSSVYGENWKSTAKFLEGWTIKQIFSQIPFLGENVDKTESNFFNNLVNFNDEETIKNLYILCQNGFFEKDGIYSWHDFLFNCVNDEILNCKGNGFIFPWTHQINQLFLDYDLYYRRYKKARGIYLRYQTRRGLEIIAQDIALFKDYFDRVPTQLDFPFAMVMLEEYEWIDYGVSTWEDLITYSKTIEPRKIKPE